MEMNKRGMTAELNARIHEEIQFRSKGYLVQTIADSLYAEKSQRLVFLFFLWCLVDVVLAHTRTSIRGRRLPLFVCQVPVVQVPNARLSKLLAQALEFGVSRRQRTLR